MYKLRTVFHYLYSLYKNNKLNFTYNTKQKYGSILKQFFVGCDGWEMIGYFKTFGWQIFNSNDSILER